MQQIWEYMYLPTLFSVSFSFFNQKYQLKYFVLAVANTTCACK